MNICLECGGRLRLVAKPGRLVWNDDELFEIPSELKISTCLQCGQSLEDLFVSAKLKKSIAGQIKTNPGQKLLLLRWIDKTLYRSIETAVDARTLYTQVILFLKFREIVLSRAEDDRSKQIDDLAIEIMKRYWPDQEDQNLLIESIQDISLFSNVMKEFCDIWIFTDR